MGCRGIRLRRDLVSGSVSRFFGFSRPPDRQCGAGQDRRYKPKRIAGAHCDGLMQGFREADFTLRGLVAQLGERGLTVDYRSAGEFVHSEKLFIKRR